MYYKIVSSALNVVRITSLGYAAKSTIFHFSAASIDEIANYYNLYTGHPLSISIFLFAPFTAFYSKVLPAYLIKPWLIKPISGFSAILSSYLTADFFAAAEELIVPLESVELTYKIFAKQNATISHNIWHNDLLVTLGGYSMLLKIGTSFLSCFWTMRYHNNLTLLNIAVNAVERDTILKPLIIYTAFQFANKFVNFLNDKALTTIQYSVLYPKIAELFYDQDNAYNIKFVYQDNYILQNLYGDLFSLSSSNELFFTFISNIVSDSMLLNMIYTHNQQNNIIIFYVCSATKSYLHQHLLDQILTLDNLYMELSSIMYNIISDVFVKLEDITRSGGMEFVKYSYVTLAQEKQYILAKQSELQQIFGTTDDISILCMIYFSAFMQYREHGAYDKLAFILSGSKINRLFEAAIYSYSNNKKFIYANARLKDLLTIHEEIKERIDHRVIDAKGITLTNYQLFLGEELLVDIPELFLANNMRYAITGASGCGKTSVLKSLSPQGVVPPMHFSGEIKTPNDLLFLTQNTYIAHENSLIEMAVYPQIYNNLSNTSKSNVISYVTSLFHELDMDGIPNQGAHRMVQSLHSKQFSLSGGQTKKLAVIQAILFQPKVLIMDEVLTGLDNSSLKKVEHAIKKYLPNVLLLSVDHHAHEHNFAFYDYELHFANHRVELREIPLTPGYIPETPFMLINAEDSCLYDNSTLICTKEHENICYI